MIEDVEVTNDILYRHVHLIAIHLKDYEYKKARETIKTLKVELECLDDRLKAEE